MSSAVGFAIKPTSTRQRNEVFEFFICAPLRDFFDSGTRFRKIAFQGTEYAVTVWTQGQTYGKKPHLHRQKSIAVWTINVLIANKDGMLLCEVNFMAGTLKQTAQ